MEPGAQGTVARIRHALTRPARLLALEFPVPATAAVPASTFRVTEEPGGDETRVSLAGPLDLSTASLAEHELLHRARGGMAWPGSPSTCPR